MSRLTAIRLIAPAVWALLALSIQRCPAAGAADCGVGIIETVAGGRVGDGERATQVTLYYPGGMALAPDGTLCVADRFGGRIRKIDRAGTITTMAGDGRHGYRGDGGPATEASLCWPSDILLAPDGRLYIADENCQRIRTVDLAGIIRSIAGLGPQAYSGDGGPAIEACFSFPRDLALGPDGSLYIADSGNCCVRKVNRAGIITTVAGTGERGYSGDGGPATAATLNRCYGVAVAGDDTLYIADASNHRIRKVDPAGVITTVAGDGYKDEYGRSRFAGDGGPAIQASLRDPEDVILAPDGALYIADYGSRRVRKVDTNGTITTVAGGGAPADGVGDGGPATEAKLDHPWRLLLAPDGSLYIAESDGHRIRKVAPNGVITTVAGQGPGDGRRAGDAALYGPNGVAVGPDGSLYVLDRSKWRIRRLQAVDGRVSGNSITTTVGQTGWHGPVVAADGSIYVTQESRVYRVDAAGVATTVAGTEGGGMYAGDGGPATKARLYDPGGLALAADGTIYIADTYNARIRKVDAAGIITTVAGDNRGRYSGDGGPAVKASLNAPQSVALSGDGSLYIADSKNHRIRRVDSNGIITTIAGTGEQGYSGDGGPAVAASLNEPDNLALAPDGTLYVVDRGNSQVRRITPDGIITTVRMDPDWEYWGDGDPATEADLYEPRAVGVGPDGALYIADMGNCRIRRVRWLPCDAEAAKRSADDLRARADDSPHVWREIFELYMIAKAYDEALAAAEKLRALMPEAERMRADVLVARVYMAKRDDHEARRRLIPILARGEGFLVLRDAADALVDLYLLRGERDQAIATLNDLRLRAQDRRLQQWIDQRVAQIGGAQE